MQSDAAHRTPLVSYCFLWYCLSQTPHMVRQTVWPAEPPEACIQPPPPSADEFTQTADEFVGARRYRSGLLGFLLLRFADEKDEAAFIQAQTAVSAMAFRKLVKLCGVVSFFHAAISIAEGAPDPMPLLAMPMAIAFFRNAKEYARSTRLRLVGMALLAAHFNMRFSIGVLLGDRSNAPPTVLFGQPLPYSLLGPSALITLATALGLRMHDSISFVVPTLMTCLLHQKNPS